MWDRRFGLNLNSEIWTQQLKFGLPKSILGPPKPILESKAIGNLKKVERVNLFHFDSDKSYRGREFAFKTIKRHLSKDAVLIFDDIQDNFHFKDLVQQYKLQYFVFEFEGKFFGVIYLHENNPFCDMANEKI